MHSILLCSSCSILLLFVLSVSLSFFICLSVSLPFLPTPSSPPLSLSSSPSHSPFQPLLMPVSMPLSTNIFVDSFARTIPLSCKVQYLHVNCLWGLIGECMSIHYSPLEYMLQYLTTCNCFKSRRWYVCVCVCARAHLMVWLIWEKGTIRVLCKRKFCKGFFV